MEINDIRTYRLLKEIEKSQSLSQRELARKLNISLGLVNAFIKRLTKKGYFKISTIPKNRVKYILTPKGAAEKARLTYEYIQYSFRYYRDARSKLKKIFSKLDHQRKKQIVIFGVGELAEIAFITLQETQLELIAVVDENAASDSFFNHPVLPPQALASLSYDYVLMTMIETSDKKKEIIESLNVQKDKMISIL
jgi:DNA-binding MarR family transcriptional regulator